MFFLSKLIENLRFFKTIVFFKKLELTKVDFENIDEDGLHIFRKLFQQASISNVSHPQLPKFIFEIEGIFFYLIAIAEKNIGEDKVNQLIETPDNMGGTFFKEVTGRFRVQTFNRC